MLRLFINTFFIASLVIGICLLAAFFSNEAFANSCTDQMMHCFPKSGDWISGILGAAKCILKNFICMITKIFSLF